MSVFSSLKKTSLDKRQNLYSENKLKIIFQKQYVYQLCNFCITMCDAKLPAFFLPISFWGKTFIFIYILQ